MTAPVEKLVELLETLPAPARQEITTWLLGRPQQTGRLSLLANPEFRTSAVLNSVGGTLPVGEESQLVTFRLPAERHAELRAWCTEHGFTMASVVRGLIERFLEDQQRQT